MTTMQEENAMAAFEGEDFSGEESGPLMEKKSDEKS